MSAEVSDCCRAEIHHDHCTKCEKPCNAMNTNDQKATAPLLSDDELAAITKRYPEVNGDTSTAYETGDEIRAWYEAKIASGELMVVKTAKATKSEYKEESWGYIIRCECGGWAYRMKFCPDCGAKIIEG